MSKEYFTGKREEGRSHSAAIKVKGGGTTIYLAGVTNRDAAGKIVQGDFATEARAAIERLRDNVEMAGGALSDIVYVTVFITDPRYGDEFVKVRSEYFQPGHYPTSALITINQLAFSGLHLEIQGIAVLEE